MGNNRFTDIPELHEIALQIAIANFNDDNKLGFRVKPENGELLTGYGNSIPEYRIGELLLHKANEQGINHIFVGDTDHTNVDKNNWFIRKDFYAELKEYGYKFGVELDESFYKEANMISPVDFKLQFRDRVVNEQNSMEQAEMYRNILLNCGTERGCGVVFCEESGKDFYESSKIGAAFRNVINGYRKILDREDFEVLAGKYKIAAEYLVIHNRIEERDAFAQQQLTGEKAFIFRGNMHLNYQDLNESVNKEESVYIINLSAGQTDMLKSFSTIQGATYRIELIDNALRDAEELGLKDKYIETLHECRKSLIERYQNLTEIPDYIVDNNKIYHGETYLRTRTITFNGKEQTYYDFLAENCAIAGSSPAHDVTQPCHADDRGR